MSKRERLLESDIRILYYHDITPQNISEYVEPQGIENLEETSKARGFDSFEDAYYKVISKHLCSKKS